MSRDDVMRRALWGTAVFNLAAATLVAFPSSAVGQLVGLPTQVPPVYSALLAFFVLLFGGAYAWLALQPTIDRPLVALAATGKAGVFAITLCLWLLGQGPGRGVVLATGDAVFAAIFTWWLVGTRTSAAIHG